MISTYFSQFYSPLRYNRHHVHVLCPSKFVYLQFHCSLTQRDRCFPDLFEKFTSVPINSPMDAFPRSLRSSTLDLASNHLVCSVALTGVLILQAGRWWAELSDGDDEPYLQEKDAEPAVKAQSAASRSDKH